MWASLFEQVPLKQGHQSSNRESKKIDSLPGNNYKVERLDSGAGASRFATTKRDERTVL